MYPKHLPSGCCGNIQQPFCMFLILVPDFRTEFKHSQVVVSMIKINVIQFKQLQPCWSCQFFILGYHFSVLEQFVKFSIQTVAEFDSSPVSSCHSNTLDSLLYTTDMSELHNVQRRYHTQAMHEMRGSGDIKLVLCIPLMLSESVSQKEKLSLEGCNSSGLLIISRNKLAEIPTLLECSNAFLVASFTCVPNVL